MTLEQKIMKNLIIDKAAVLSDIKTASEKNKDGETLYYIKESVLELKSGSSEWYNMVTYHAFDAKGENVSNVLVEVRSSKKAVLEYETIEKYQNKGNVTVIVKEAIKDIFESNMLDGLKTSSGNPKTYIEYIEVDISPYNIPSKRVAEKLGFSTFGYLDREDYYKLKEEQSISTGGLKK